MRVLAVAFCVCLGLSTQAAQAVLKTGDAAPDFIVRVAQGGVDYTFALAEALKIGPVVLYFCPKPFAKNCTEDAHGFVEAMANFAAERASVIALSADPIDVQREFSAQECQDKFLVGADPALSAISAYEARSGGLPMASRTSYVISPASQIVSAYTGPDAEKHIGIALAAVRKWREEHGGPGRWSVEPVAAIPVAMAALEEPAAAGAQSQTAGGTYENSLPSPGPQIRKAHHPRMRNASKPQRHRHLANRGHEERSAPPRRGSLAAHAVRGFERAKRGRKGIPVEERAGSRFVRQTGRPRAHRF